MVQKIYLYVVLFATLLMTIGGSVSAVMSLADLISPAPYYQSYDDFVLMKNMSVDKNGNEVKYSNEELQKMYDQMVESERKRATNRATNGLMKSLAWIIIPFPIFFTFQRKIRKSE